MDAEEDGDGSVTGCSEGALLCSMTFDGSLSLGLVISLSNALDGHSCCAAVCMTSVALVSSASIDV
jgi:hypothetical protein